MSLHLDRDSSAHFQAHLDELTGRFTLLFATILVTTLLFSTQIDGWLESLLVTIDPCKSECLNLYDPARWSAVRWLSAAIAATVAATPLILQQAWAFSKKGLLPSERKWMIRWMLGSAVVSFSIAALTLAWLLPSAFATGHAIQSDMGLTARYDAVLMLSIAVAVIWTQIIVSVAILGMAIAGQLGVMNSQTADWWRLRCYGLVVLLLYASLPEFGGLAFLLIVVSISIMEIVCGRWFRRSPPQNLEMVTVMDEEGGSRRPIIVECLCDGAAVPLPSPIDLSMPHMMYSGLCSSEHQREEFYDAIKFAKATDVFVTGCNATPLGEKFHSNCHALGAKVSGMDLLTRQSYRTRPGLYPELEFKLMVAQLGSPWPSSAQNEKIADLLDTHEVERCLVSTNHTDRLWGLQLKEEDVLLTLPQDHLQAFNAAMAGIDCTIVPLAGQD